ESRNLPVSPGWPPAGRNRSSATPSIEPIHVSTMAYVGLSPKRARNFRFFGRSGNGFANAQQEGGIDRLEAEGLELFVAARDVDRQGLNGAGQLLQGRVGGIQTFQGGDIDDEMTAGPQSAERGLEQPGHLLAGAADEDGIGPRQTLEHRRRRAVD